jgi:HPt (histidine-containing phosphotransfer) domain-containing protein
LAVVKSTDPGWNLIGSGSANPAGPEERNQRMFSSSPIAGRGPIDLDHLERNSLGDPGLAREVLGLFAEQLTRVVGQLATLPSDADVLAHTLKGSAQAIGAFDVAEAAAALELAIHDERAPTRALADLDAAATAARAAVEEMLRQP